MNQINTHQQVVKIGDHNQVSLSLSKYKDCLFLFVNSTGAPGSVLEGKMIQAAGQIICEELEEIGEQQTSPLYQMKVLFGSSQIQFYELFLRRILSLIWQQLKVKDNFKVLLNISLPITSPNFEEHVYYTGLIQSLRKSLTLLL